MEGPECRAKNLDDVEGVGDVGGEGLADSGDDAGLPRRWLIPLGDVQHPHVLHPLVRHLLGFRV